MSSDKTKAELLRKLHELQQKQALFQQEINDLQFEITQLRFQDEKPVSKVVEKEKVHETVPAESERKATSAPPRKTTKPPAKKAPGFWEKSGIGSELEQFIGTNLINKIGMVVVIIGVGIGAKYAIDNNLISPLVRILLGYLVGGILTFLAIRLKKKFFDFSAVLFSGAMTVYYYISYAAYSYYSLYSSNLTFLLMVLFTVLTVALALYYKRQVIAHFGLVGAYLVPFLVGDPDSSVVVLFTYMLIINAGILFISTKKQWKPLNYLAFVATWVIYFSWFGSTNYNNELGIAITFAATFFVIFYLVFLSYKLIFKENPKPDDIIYLLLNACVFYLIGMLALGMKELTDAYGGLFTASNALVHGLTAFLIFKKSEKNELFFWTVGMLIAFITVAVALQFNDYITAIIWAGEAAFLFWLGRRKQIKVFDFLSFALVSLTFIITVSNWVSVSYPFYPPTIEEMFNPVFSMEFLSSLVVIAAFSFIYYTSRRLALDGTTMRSWLDIFNILFPLFFLTTLFFTFYNEIDLFWNNLQIYSSYEPNSDGSWAKVVDSLNPDIFAFKTMWLLHYSLVFVSVLALANYKWIKNMSLNAVVFILAGLMILIFLGNGLYALSVLRNSYLETSVATNFDVTVFHLLIRYVGYLFFALLCYSVYRFSISMFTNENFTKVFEIILSGVIVWISSSELINWLSLSGSTEVYKHGLSILWGILSFILIGYGIWKKKKHLRITSIILFGATLLKLFTFDLSNLDTIQKTIAFITVGAILLVVSFMYNKYKSLIFGKDEQNKWIAK